ncbi:MAG: DMT family transporter [Anaerolineales bacterium]|nr:DMT family transporter [Anaerolineales bacterium]
MHTLILAGFNDFGNGKIQRVNMPEALRKNVLIPVLEALFAVIAWGASFVATKVALRYVSPVTVVWLRFAMGVAILGMAMFLREQFAVPAKNEWAYLALLGFLGITLHQWLQSTGLVTAQATTSAWIVATIPVFMALLGWLVLGEKLAWRQILGIFLAALGVLSVVAKGDFAVLRAGKVGTVGDILVLLSAPNWAIFSTLSRRGLKGHPATWMMFYVMGFGWLFTSVLFLRGPGLGEISHLAWDGWLGIGFLGIFCSGLAYIFWYDALQVLPVAQTGAFIYLEPLVTVVIAAVVIGEPLLWSSLLGGGIILLGVWLVQGGWRHAEQE